MTINENISNLVHKGLEWTGPCILRAIKYQQHEEELIAYLNEQEQIAQQDIQNGLFDKSCYQCSKQWNVCNNKQMWISCEECNNWQCSDHLFDRHKNFLV